jgi:hypothetical protein
MNNYAMGFIIFEIVLCLVAFFICSPGKKEDDEDDED